MKLTPARAAGRGPLKVTSRRLCRWRAIVLGSFRSSSQTIFGYEFPLSSHAVRGDDR